MAIRKHANNISTTLNGAITNVATTLIVTSATGLPAIGAGEEYNLTLDNGAGIIEIVIVTDDASSPTLTVTRGAEGTTAVAWADLATIELRPTADGFDRKADLDSPILVTPNLGTPSAGVMTNVTGTAAGLTAGNVTTNANLTGDVTSVGNATTIAAGVVDVAMLSIGTDGELITWDASGNPATIPVGTATHVLTSNGVGAPPTFQVVPGGATTTAFYAYANTNQSLTGAVANKITLDTELFDTGGLFDSTTNYRYTPNVAGKYYIAYNIVISSPTSGMYMLAQAYKNGASVAYARINNGVDTSFLTCYGGAMIDMNGSTDYLEFYVLPSVAKSLLGGQVYCYFTGVLMEAT